MIYTGISNTPIARSLITHSFVWWDNIFTEDEFKLLSSYFDNHGTDKTGTIAASDNNKTIRSSQIKWHWLSNENQWIFDRFNLAIQQINNNFYGFELNGYDHMQYGEYHAKDNGKYDWHVDMQLGENPGERLLEPRKLSLTFLLNEPGVDFEGGELEIANSITDVKQAESKKGRIIAFPSWMNHRVTTVTKGIRKSLVIWVTGPKFR